MENIPKKARNRWKVPISTTGQMSGRKLGCVWKVTPIEVEKTGEALQPRQAFAAESLSKCTVGYYRQSLWAAEEEIHLIPCEDLMCPQREFSGYLGV